MTLTAASLDMGGNAETLTPKAPVGPTYNASSLHSFWDGIGGDALSVPTFYSSTGPGVRMPEFNAYIAGLTAAADAAKATFPEQQAGVVRYNATALKDSKGTLPLAWIAESGGKAAVSVYAGPVLEAVMASRAVNSTRPSINAAGPAWEAYTTATRTLCRQQLVLGGLRLAAVLNGVLTDPVVLPSAPPAPDAPGCGGAVGAAVVGWLLAAALGGYLGWLRYTASRGSKVGALDLSSYHAPQEG